MKKLVITAMAAMVLLSATMGCKGPFVLTKRIDTWVNSQSDDWTDELVFLVCVIIPVYGVCILGDAIIFNSIEFWTGDNPVASTTMGDSRMERLADGSIRVTTPQGDFRLVKGEEGISAYDSQGKFLGKAATIDGKIVLQRDDMADAVPALL